MDPALETLGHQRQQADHGVVRASTTPPGEGQPPDDQPPGDQPPGGQPPGGSQPPGGQPPGDQPPGGGQPPGDQPPSGGGPPAGGSPSGAPDQQERTWAIVAHLSGLVQFVGIPFVVGPFVVWLLTSDRGRFARDQATEALNFSLSFLIYGIALAVLGIVLAFPTAGLAAIPLVLLGLALGILWLVLVIVAAVRSSNDVWYRYPLTIRMVGR